MGEFSQEVWAGPNNNNMVFDEDEVFLSAPKTALRSVALRTGSLTIFFGGGDEWEDRRHALLQLKKHRKNCRVLLVIARFI